MRIGIASTYYARHGGAISSVDRRFASAAERRGADVVHIDPLACSYEMETGRTAIRLAGKTLALDALLVRRAALHWHAAKTLVLMAHEGGTVCIDGPETFLGTLSGKFQAQLRRYRLPGCHTPRSFLYLNAESVARTPPPREAFPLLRKPVRGSLGEGIEPVADPAALRAYVARYDFGEPLLLQEHLRGVEFRALLLADACLGVVEKVPGEGGLGNIARGARFVPAPAARARELTALGRRIMERAPYDFAALDVIRTEDGRYWALECNRNPHFRGFEAAFPDVDVPGAVIDLLVARVGATSARRANSDRTGPVAEMQRIPLPRSDRTNIV